MLNDLARSISADNEDNEAGLKGAIGTAEYLESHGIATKLITLPRPDGVDKIDLAEYLRDHSVDEFRALLGTSQAVWDVKLSRQPVSDNAVENVKSAELFIVSELLQMDAAERAAFTESGIKKHFKLSDRIIKELQNIVLERDPKEYFDGRRFVPKRLANDITAMHTFKSMSDTGAIYVYHDGVYVYKGKETIESEAQRRLGERSSTYNVNESMNHIKRDTYVDRDEFDKDEDIINLANGLFDIRTMELQPHSEKHLSLQKSPIEYDPTAKCNRIERFFREVLRDVDIEFVFELFGYALLKEKRMNTSVIFHGKGRNGKSIMLMLLEAFVGEEMCSHVTPSEISGDDKFAAADMFGKLVNTIDDLGEKPLRNLGVFKSVVSGKKIRAQNKFERAFTFRPSVLCVFACNDVPPTADVSDAFFDRIRTISFLQTFDGKNDNKNLIDELTTANELSGLFNITIKAVKQVLDCGSFSDAMTIEEKRRAYMYASNPVVRFVDELCDLSDPDVETPKDEVYGAYVLWSRDLRLTVRDKGRLTQHLETLGVTIARPTIDGVRVWCYKGIRLRSKHDGGKTKSVQPVRPPSNHVQPEKQQRDTTCPTCPTTSPLITKANKKSRDEEGREIGAISKDVGYRLDRLDNHYQSAQNRVGQQLDTGWTDNTCGQPLDLMNTPRTCGTWGCMRRLSAGDRQTMWFRRRHTTI